MFSIITGLVLKPAVEWIGSWVRGKVEEKQAATQVKVAEAQARIANAERKVAAEIEWEARAVDQLSSSWKDEFITVIFLLPLILAFIPGMEDIVAIGFNNINTLVPQWYIYLLGFVVASGLGLRKAADVIKYFKK